MIDPTDQPIQILENEIVLQRILEHKAREKVTQGQRELDQVVSNLAELRAELERHTPGIVAYVNERIAERLVLHGIVRPEAATGPVCVHCDEPVQPIVGGDYDEPRPLATVSENDPACGSADAGLGHEVAG